MGWFFEEMTLQQLIAERTQEQNSTGPDGFNRTNTCLTHTYIAASENFGVLWSVRERRYFQQVEVVERWIVCDVVESRNGLWGYKSMAELDGPSYYSVPLSYLSMVPIEVYGGDAQWREAVLDAISCDEERQP